MCRDVSPAESSSSDRGAFLLRLQRQVGNRTVSALAMRRIDRQVSPGPAAPAQHPLRPSRDRADAAVAAKAVLATLAAAKTSLRASPVKYLDSVNKLGAAAKSCGAVALLPGAQGFADALHHRSARIEASRVALLPYVSQPVSLAEIKKGATTALATARSAVGWMTDAQGRDHSDRLRASVVAPLVDYTRAMSGFPPDPKAALAALDRAAVATDQLRELKVEAATTINTLSGRLEIQRAALAPHAGFPFTPAEILGAIPAIEFDLMRIGAAIESAP